MGSTIFYIPDDLMNDLKGVGNRSALITSLLKEYFAKGKPLRDIKQDITKQTQLLTEKAYNIEQQILKEEEERSKEEERNNIINQKEREEKEKEIKKLRRISFKEIFIKYYDINKEDIEPFLDEFINLLDSEKIKNIIEFMELKQIKRKVKKE